MIGRLVTAEVAGLRRSTVPWLAMLLVVGGSVVARVLAWVTHAIGRTELAALPFIPSNVGWSDVAVPLSLLAYLIVTSYLFGRDFEDGNIDLVLTAPVIYAGWIPFALIDLFVTVYQFACFPVYGISVIGPVDDHGADRLFLFHHDFHDVTLLPRSVFPVTRF